MDTESLNSRRRIVRIYVATTAGTALWLAAVVGAPYLRSRGVGGAGFLYACFAPFCHQLSSRSFFLWGFPLAVCARCLGIYAGFAAGVLFYPVRRGFFAARLPALKIFVLVSLPIVLDTGGNFLKLWNTGSLLRFLLGFLWGTILPFYWFAGLADLFSRQGGGRRTTENGTRSDSGQGEPGAAETAQK
ncbi:MAG: DUF2085 domain-containing protein [Candidatus Aminicenantales bacterium]